MKKLIKILILGLLLILSGITLFACNSPNEETTDWSCSISVLPTQNGSLTVDKSTVTVMQNITISITPNDGYKLKEGSLKITPSASYKLSENAETFYLLTASFMPKQNTTITAEFEKISKTFTYDYQGATRDISVKNITINYDDISNTTFPIPQRENCKFEGWYLGADPYGFFSKISDDKGKAVFTKDVFYNRFDTLYARWIADDSPVYPILLVYVDEVKAKLNSNYKRSATNPNDIYDIGTEYSINVDYKMTAIEKQICTLITKQVWGCLNLMFNGLVNFEVNEYFTTTVLGNETISGGDNSGLTSYGIMANDIAEVAPMLKDYKSVLTVFGMNDYESLLHNVGGSASIKYGYSHVETVLESYINSHIPIEDLLNLNNKLTVNHWETVREHYLHEFTHTVELSLNSVGQKVYNFHDFPSGLNYIKSYLLNQAEADGQKVGIPLSFWKGETNVLVSFLSNIINGKIAGKVVIVGDNTTNPNDYVVKRLPYGSDISVEAIPFEGYRFVKWSDGILTAARHDSNITSYVNPIAIFEKVS